MNTTKNTRRAKGIPRPGSGDRGALDRLLEGYGKAMTVPEVAAALRMSKQGVYNWLRDGTITGYKIGASWFILREDLKDRFVAGVNSAGTRAEGNADGYGHGLG